MGYLEEVQKYFDFPGLADRGKIFVLKMILLLNGCIQICMVSASAGNVYELLTVDGEYLAVS